MRWWTGCPHPCIGCGAILQYRKAKRCRKCKRAHTREFENARYRERRERGVCVACGKVPAFQGGSFCEPHRERAREYDKKARAERRWRNQKFVNCEICGCLLRKNGNVKYCRPCSVGVWHDRIYNERKREGLCTECGRVPKGKTLRCEKCRLDKKLKDIRREIRKEERNNIPSDISSTDYSN